MLLARANVSAEGKAEHEARILFQADCDISDGMTLNGRRRPMERCWQICESHGRITARMTLVALAASLE